MKKYIIICILVLFNLQGNAQRIITENQDIYCEINIEDLINQVEVVFKVIIKTNKAIYLPKEEVNSGLSVIGEDMIHLHLGWDQQKTFNIDFELIKIVPGDTVSFVYKLIGNSFKAADINELKIDINYLKSSKFKKRKLPRIWFNDYMSKMDWYSVTVEL